MREEHDTKAEEFEQEELFENINKSIFAESRTNARNSKRTTAVTLRRVPVRLSCWGDKKKSMCKKSKTKAARPM